MHDRLVCVGLWGGRRYLSGPVVHYRSLTGRDMAEIGGGYGRSGRLATDFWGDGESAQILGRHLPSSLSILGILDIWENSCKFQN